MSRIEEALRKAKELSGTQSSAPRPAPPATTKASERTLVRFPSVAAEIEISSPRLVAVNDCNLPITEEYKKLKSTVIRKIKLEARSRQILVTSALSGDGKSVTALNLAISLAQDYDCAVTLIDADLRNPSLCRYLGLGRKPGLSDCLADGVDLESVLLDTGMGNLTLLAAGRRVDNPVELLSSQQLVNLLARLEQLIPDGYIIIDSCPILPFAEPRVLSSLVDNCIFVVKEGGTSLQNFHEALECLNHSHLLGVVYNKATFFGLAGGYQYYYYDYAKRDQRTTDRERNLDPPGLLARLLHKLTGN